MPATPVPTSPTEFEDIEPELLLERYGEDLISIWRDSAGNPYMTIWCDCDLDTLDSTYYVFMTTQSLVDAYVGGDAPVFETRTYDPSGELKSRTWRPWSEFPAEWKPDADSFHSVGTKG
jgi:hypothetical protein